MEMKLIAGGTKIKVKIEEKGPRYFLDFPFSRPLMAEIKVMEGAKWHGFEDPPLKKWSILNSPRNQFQLAYLRGENPYAHYDQPIGNLSTKRKVYEHQRFLFNAWMTYRSVVWAAEMGCVSGNAVVTVKSNTGHVTGNLKGLFQYWLDGHEGEDLYIQSWDGTKIIWNKIINVLDKGVKLVVSIRTPTRRLEVTPDHEICVGDKYLPAEMLGRDATKILTIIGLEDVLSVDMVMKSEHVYDIVCDDPHRNFVANGIVVHNCGKTLAAIEGIEYVNPPSCFWVGPKSALAAVRLEFRKWNATVTPEFLTYEGLVKRIKEWTPGERPPAMIVFDESSRCKTPTSQRSQAAQHIADNIRSTWGENGYVLEMSGSPAPGSPADWFKQCEIVCPGYIREGTIAKFTERLAVVEQNENTTGGKYNRLVAWKDNADKCATCGQLKESIDHTSTVDVNSLAHPFVASVNEVEALYRRMKGLVHVKFKKDCLDLPDKIYRQVICKPKPQTLNAVRMLLSTAPSSAVGLIWCRELSDGFQYEDKPIRVPHKECGGKGCELCDDGTIASFERITTEVACPKEDALIELLDEHDDVGRIVIYAGFTGSLDRVERICQKFAWETIRVDGRGWKMSHQGIDTPEDALMRFQDRKVTDRIAFVGHPGSAGMGLTLTASPTIVYYSNDFSGESRIQSEDRIHRPGMDLNRGATIVDLLHLPTDLKILQNLQKKRDLQSLTMGEINEAMMVDLSPGERA